MNLKRYRRFQTSLALTCIAALFGTFAPGAASTDLAGIDPISKWVAAMPATCGFYMPRENYWVGNAMDNDWNELPRNPLSEWIQLRKSNPVGVVRIRAFYDPVNRIAYYSEDGNETLNKAILADAPAPPAHVTTRRDLSSLRLAGNIRLGDTIAQVANDIGLKGTLHPSPGKGACKEFSMAGLCSWNKKGCECPHLSRPERIGGTVVFRRGRVVALFRDEGACGFG